MVDPRDLAAAIAARQQGFRVTVADGAQMPIDKPCGEGLMPDGLAALEKLGVSVEPEDSYPFRGIRFLSRGLAARCCVSRMERSEGGCAEPSCTR